MVAEIVALCSGVEESKGHHTITGVANSYWVENPEGEIVELTFFARLRWERSDPTDETIRLMWLSRDDAPRLLVNFGVASPSFLEDDPVAYLNLEHTFRVGLLAGEHHRVDLLASGTVVGSAYLLVRDRYPRLQ